MRVLQDDPELIEATPHETSVPRECHSPATMRHICRPGLQTLFFELTHVLSLMRREKPCSVHDMKLVIRMLISGPLAGRCRPLLVKGTD